MSRHRRIQRREQRAARGKSAWRRFLEVFGILIMASAVLLIVELLPGNQSSGNMMVVDGDSLRQGNGGSDIRLHAIDAPELAQYCQRPDGKRYNCGRRARDHLRQLIGGREVSCITMDVDRYERSVAVCKAGDTDLNRQMVRDGWALAYRQHDRVYSGAEAEAKAAKRGIWQGEFDPPADWRRMNQGSMAGEPD